MKIVVSGFAAVVLLLVNFSIAQNSPDFTGAFKGDKLAADFNVDGSGYTGKITLGTNQFPLKAHVENGELQGSFQAGANSFPFTAQLSGATLSLVSGTTTYTLTRADAPAANPLSQPDQPANPLTQTPAASPVITAPATPSEANNSGPTFGPFTVLGTTATGKTLFLKLPKSLTLEAAITQTADALGKVSDAKPSITQAFANAQSKDKGGASLDVKLKGSEMHGVIFCGSNANGGSATVIIDKPGASKEEMSTLFGFMPADLKMTTHNFPDGSGSIDLPDGWTTPTTTASGPVVGIGPGGRAVVFGAITEIYDPNSSTVRLGRQVYDSQMRNYNFSISRYQQMVRMHQQFPNTPAPTPPPPPPVAPDPDPNVDALKHKSPLRYCKYCDGPEEMLKVWYPLSADLSRQAGKPYSTIDKIFAIVPDPNPGNANVKAGTVYIAVSDHDGDKIIHSRALNYISTSNIMPGEVWQLDVCIMRGPDATFEKDLPLLTAIQNSVKLNMDVVNKEISDSGEATRKMGRDSFATMQKNHAAWQQQQNQQFADFEQQMAVQEQARHDSASDFIEYIGGVRDVYDTQTGEMGKVDLFNSNAIVGALNDATNDPHRFVQIPLRYER